MRYKSGIIDLIRIVLGMLFLYAAIDKILYPARFAEVIYHYKILPIPFINFFALIIPWIEVGIGLSLIFNQFAETGSLILIVLTTAFVIMIASAMMRGLNIECGCFSLESKSSYVGWKRILEDLVMIAGGILVFIESCKKNMFSAHSSAR
ncbi:MAG: MauE/DoxX family redox-associated membrane protein [Fidelibacterota bacterium]